MRWTVGADMKLNELLENFSEKKETGLLKILPADDTDGEIYLKEGRPVHAVFGILEGLDAVYALARVETAEVLFEPFKKPKKETLPGDVGIEELLEQRRIKVEEIDKRLPPPDTILIKSDELPNAGSLVVRKTDWQVLLLFDGKRDLKSVLEISPLPPETTRQAVVWLIEAGLLIFPAGKEEI